tara:strand:+ start:837 stop:1004 length:168 start_codon:yes stop_codon:yes gene_type:complete
MILPMKIIVLDFETGQVNVYIVKKEPKDLEMFIMARDHNLNNCSWMLTTNEIIIN